MSLELVSVIIVSYLGIRMVFSVPSLSKVVFSRLF